MIKKIPIFSDLPIEEGKTYKTRFATGDLFFVKKVVKVKEKVIRFDGIYWGKKDLGICPIGVDRLIAEKIIVGAKYVCEKCDAEIDIKKIVQAAWEAGYDYASELHRLENPRDVMVNPMIDDYITSLHEHNADGR